MPFETEDASESGIVYVWIGSKSTPEESKLIQEIAEEMFNNPWVSLQVGFLVENIFHKIESEYQSNPLSRRY